MMEEIVSHFSSTLEREKWISKLNHYELNGLLRMIR